MKGQLWIATHSVHILAELEYDEIFLVKDDQLIEPKRAIPQGAYDELMGLSGHSDKFRLFNRSISEWSYAGFMQRCFIDPEVVFGKSLNDPQFKLFKEFSEKSGSTINLLDYGAGLGRIGLTINEDESLKTRINYCAFEQSDQQEKLTALKNLPFIKGLYTEFDEIADDSFDLILVCNVLHEIDPRKWLEILIQLKKKLRENGHLLIIEDKHLPKGEKILDFGYLILSEPQLSVLMQTTESFDYDFKERNPRMVFAPIPKSKINPSDDSVIQAIESLRDESLKNIKKYRLANDLDEGRKYANQTQLYVNSVLALEKMKI